MKPHLSVTLVRQAIETLRATPGNQQRSRMEFYRRHARVTTCAPIEATVEVTLDGESARQVKATLVDDQVRLECTCSPPTQPNVDTCVHVLTASLALWEHLGLNPIITWESRLESVLKERRPSRRPGSVVVVFSLVHQGINWILQPYTLNASLLGAIDVRDAAAVARAITTGRLSKSARPIQSRVDPSRFANCHSETAIAIDHLVTAQQLARWGNDRAVNLGTILSLLTDFPLFLARTSDPLSRRLHVSTEPLHMRLKIEARDAGMSLSVEAHRSDGAPFSSKRKVHVVSEEPLWILGDDTLYPVEGDSSMSRQLLDNAALEIPSDGVDVFINEYLPRLASELKVSAEGLAWTDVVSDPLGRIYLSESPDGLQAEFRIAYDRHEIAVDRSPAESLVRRKSGESLELIRIVRQPDREEILKKGLSSHGLRRTSEPGIFSLRSRVTPVEFLLHHVPRLTGAGYEVYGEERLVSARVNRQSPSVTFTVSSTIDWFDVQAVVTFGDLVASLDEVRKTVKRRERYVKLPDGSIGELPDELLERFRHLFGFGEATDESVRFAHHHGPLVDELLSGEPRFEPDATFRTRLNRFAESASSEHRPLPSGFHGELRDYQRVGYQWLHLMHEGGFGACLADDMGIGKTVQALALLLSLRESGHADRPDLIVMPRSLLFNWQREAERFTPALRVQVHADNDRKLDDGAFTDVDLVLTTYGIMRRDIGVLKRIRFHYAILDESQAIKNPASLTARAARALDADHRLVLTGTPVENSTAELWSQFAYLNPGLLGGVEYFKKEFGTAIDRTGDADAAEMLQKIVRPFILRRTKDQVATELPPREERLLVSDMEPGQRRLYERTRDYYRAVLLGLIDDEGMQQARFKVLEGLLRLRQICNHPCLVEPDSQEKSAKFEHLIETLETLRAEGHKALVFSQFVQMLSLVRNELDARKIPYAYLDGRTQDRQSRVDTFQQDSTIPFFLISLKAGGTGLNLTAADYVIHVDPWWNPAVEMQATDRTHRIGQEKPVIVYRLIARDSVEEKILALQDRKRELVSQLIVPGSRGLKDLTTEDVKALFS